MKRSILWFGGDSEERLVSVASAQNLVKNFDFDEIYFWDVSGEVYQESQSDVVTHANPFTECYQPKGSKVSQAGLASDFLMGFQKATIFLGFHGGIAENGVLQTELERHRIFFTASGSEASRLAMDKSVSKSRVAKLGGRVPQGCVVDLDQDPNWQLKLKERLASWGSIVIKPNASGSSFGLYFVSSLLELDEAAVQMQKLQSQFSNYLCEERVLGRELTVGYVEAFENTNAMSLPPSEVLLEANRSFDYQGKYLGSGVKEVTPAHLTPAELAQAQELSQLAHESVGAYGYSRTDMILTPKGEMVFLEINTLPGLSQASFIPQQLAVQDLSLAKFIAGQMSLAALRYSR